MTYCEAAPGHPYHGPYHDEVYGFFVSDDNRLFERLVLEINQAGLSWLTILKKQEAFREAFSQFDIAKVAVYSDADRERLLTNSGIIRNRSKIDAAIHNAKVIQQLQASHGSFSNWINTHHPLPKSDWIRLFKKTFRFTGNEITNEFLMSTGYLPGAHSPDCPVYARILAHNPPWVNAKKFP